MTMTLSPSSTCGVKVGLCLPRRRLATREARRPTTRPSASISTHFFVTSAGFCEKVFMVCFFQFVTFRRRRFLLLGLARRDRQANKQNGGHCWPLFQVRLIGDGAVVV